MRRRTIKAPALGLVMERDSAVPMYLQLASAIEAQIREVTGFDFVVSGSSSVSIFPVSAVTFQHVGLRDAAD